MMFLNKIFVVNPLDRISLNEILNDPWLTNNHNELEIENDRQLAQQFFNQITNKSKQEREINLNEAKKHAHEKIIGTEVVFAQSVARSTSCTLESEGNISTQNSGEENQNKVIECANTKLIPPYMNVKHALNPVIRHQMGSPLDHYDLERRNRSNQMNGLESFRLFTSTPPLSLLQWIEQEFDTSHNGSEPLHANILKINIDFDKFHVNIEITSPSSSSSSSSPFSTNEEMISVSFELQIWSLENEEGVYLLEGSYLSNDDDSGDEIKSSLTLFEKVQQQVLLSSFWYDDLLDTCLKSRGCLEASQTLSDYKQPQVSSPIQSMVPAPHCHQESLFFYPPKPPPRDDDPMFNETLQDNQDVKETTVLLDTGHDDIF